MIRTPTLALLMFTVGLRAQGPPPAAQPAAQPPPSTNIYLLDMGGGLESLKGAKPQPLAVEKGYENQPFFTPDGRAVLFTANRDGKQMDIYEHTLPRAESGGRGGATRALISTPEGEYSPTIAPGGAVSVIRVESDGTQRLWQFERDGRNPRVLLNEIKPVGYHTWIDADTLVLFVLGKPATLQLARVSTGKAEVVATDIGRSIQRVPGRRAVSFVQRDPDGSYTVKQFDTATRQITVVARAVSGSSDRDCAWTLDGTLLMSAGTRLFAWAARATEWREVYDGAVHGLGAMSRVAVSPDGRAMAIVAAETPGR